MLNSIFESFLHSTRYYACRSSASHNRLHFLQLSNLSSSSKQADKESFIASYLINSCGYSPENAVVPSKYLVFSKPEQPDSVILFLKNQGFSDVEVFTLIRMRPQILELSPERNLLPKIEFLRSQQVSQTDLLSILPYIVGRSLKNHIIPSFEFLTNLIGTKEDTIDAIKRCPRFLYLAQRMVVPNVDTLLRVGVPEERVASFLRQNPGKFLQQPERYKDFVDSVKEMGMNPQKSTFLIGVMVIGQLNRVTWDKKMEVYKRWGCSEEEVMTAFKLCPSCMLASADKIEGILEYMVNELGWSAPVLMKSPNTFSYSLRRRIIPRCSVYQVLLKKGLTRAVSSLLSMLSIPETKFLSNFVTRYEKEAPELLQVYREKLKQPS